MTRARGLLTLGLAIVLAGVSVVLARAWLIETARDPANASKSETAELETVPIAVAARPLRYGDKLRPGDVRLMSWPKAAVPPGALHDLEWLGGTLDTNDGRDPAVLRPMAPNEPVLTSKVSGFGSPSRIAAAISPGKRATTISMRGAPDMAALIGPDDRVDIVIAREVSDENGSRELRSDILLRDVRVLGLDDGTGAPGSSSAQPRAVTLEVTVEEAQILAVAEKIGTLSLALRGIGTRDTAPSRPVSSRDLPAGRKGGKIEPAAWSDTQHAKPDATARPRAALPWPQDTQVRIIRGLEASNYDVVPEGGNSAASVIDAAKAGLARTGAAR